MSRFVQRNFIAMAVVFALGGSAAGSGFAQDAVAAPHPAHIHMGTCAELDPNPEYPLNEVAPVSAEAEPGAVEVGEETSVDVALDDLLASPHAINIHESTENVDTYIACGEIAGAVADGVLAIGLRELNGSGYSGVAVLTDNGATTDVAIYLGFGLNGDVEATPDASPVAAEEVTVSIFDYGFEAATIEVTVGTTVTWTNDGGVIHTTTSNDGLWDSRIMSTGDVFSYTFDETGTYEYICALHPSMVGTVVVTEP